MPQLFYDSIDFSVLQPLFFKFFQEFQCFSTARICSGISVFQSLPVSVLHCFCISCNMFFYKKAVILRFHIFSMYNSITNTPYYNTGTKSLIRSFFIPTCTHLSFLPGFALYQRDNTHLCSVSNAAVPISKGGHTMLYIFLAAAVLCLGNFVYAYLTAQDNPYEE